MMNNGDSCLAGSQLGFFISGMKRFLFRIPFLFVVFPAYCFGLNGVVNMSHYDTMRADFARMKAEGIIGVIHEASYPRYERDAYYAARQNAATRAGLLWGAYHYGNGNDPIRQADHFLQIVSSAWERSDPAGQPDGILLVLDFEKNGHYPGRSMRLDQAVAFVERIRERTGKYPGIYSGEYHLRQVLKSPRISGSQKRVLTNCWLWLANYGARPEPTLPWTRWHLWQYCGDGICRLPRRSYPKSVANIIKAERNIFSGSRTELEAFWHDHAWQPGAGTPRRNAESVMTLTAER